MRLNEHMRPLEEKKSDARQDSAHDLKRYESDPGAGSDLAAVVDADASPKRGQGDGGDQGRKHRHGRIGSGHFSLNRHGHQIEQHAEGRFRASQGERGHG